MIDDKLKLEAANLLREFERISDQRWLAGVFSFAIAVRVDDSIFAKAAGNTSVEFTAKMPLIATATDSL